MQAAQAELLYIKEVEKLDGFGQESFAAKVDHPRPSVQTPTCVGKVAIPFDCLNNSLCLNRIYFSSTGQLHQWYFHRCVLYWGVCETQKWQIYYATQVSSAFLFISLYYKTADLICETMDLHKLFFMWKNVMKLLRESQFSCALMCVFLRVW